VTPTNGLIADTVAFSNVDGPGNRFVVFLQGCNFDCIACHNPQTIPGHDPLDGFGPQRSSITELLTQIRRAAPFISGVTASGGEATQQSAFLSDLFGAINADPTLAHLTTFVDSNGACDAGTWDMLAPVIDGAMIDLKCFDSTIHEQMTGHPNDEVLASISHLQEQGLLYEVRLLLLAGVNDDPELLTETAEWLAALNPHMRIKIIGFRPHGTRPHSPPMIKPTAKELQSCADIFTTVAPFEIQII